MFSCLPSSERTCRNVKGVGQEVEESHSREEFGNQTQDSESSHIEDAAIHAAHQSSVCQQVSAVSRRGLGADTDVDDETVVSEKFTTLLKGERRKMEREEIDVLMKVAFGATTLKSDGGTRETPWCKRWEKVIELCGRHYDLPGGSVGRKYVDLITEEMQHLTSGIFHQKDL